MKIFLSSGEASGDHLAGALMAALKRRFPGVTLWGMGGTESKQQGMETEWSSEILHLMGIGEVLSSIPRLLRLKKEIYGRIGDEKPDAIVVVDSPDFHIPLLRQLRQSGFRGKIVYLAPPQVWAWRSGRSAFLKETCDLCLPLFGFENDVLLAKNVCSAWIGHPFVDEFPPQAGQGRKASNHVALLPGSRKNEVWRLLPVLVEVAKALLARGFEPVFSIAPGLRALERERLAKALSGFSMDTGRGRDLMRDAFAVIGASGTAAVEAMMLDRYMVVLYRTSLSSEMIFRMCVRTSHISIPNLLAGTRVYPELVQAEARTGPIMNLFDAYRSDEGRRREIHERLEVARSMMGEPGAVDFWAKNILEGSGPEWRG